MTDGTDPAGGEPPVITPHTAALQAAVSRVYETFGTGHVSRFLEVCLCPVCMDEPTRQRIIDTPSNALGIILIRAYSNSAHGVPRDLDDLRLMLPRYLDWIARDEMVDDIGVGTDLLRFGDARRLHPDLYSSAQDQALQDWARQVLWHFSFAEAEGMDNLHSPIGLMESLLVGGWDARFITGAMDALIADPHVGETVLASVLSVIRRRFKPDKAPPSVDWFAIRYVDDETRQVLADWFNSDALRDALEALATDRQAAPDTQTYARILRGAQGRFAVDSFPRDRHA